MKEYGLYFVLHSFSRMYSYATALDVQPATRGNITNFVLFPFRVFLFRTLTVTVHLLFASLNLPRRTFLSDEPHWLVSVNLHISAVFASNHHCPQIHLQGGRHSSLGHHLLRPCLIPTRTPAMRPQLLARTKSRLSRFLVPASGLSVAAPPGPSRARRRSSRMS